MGARLLCVFLLIPVLDIHGSAKRAALASTSSEDSAESSATLEESQQEGLSRTSDQRLLVTSGSPRIGSEPAVEVQTDGINVDLLLLPSRQFRKGTDLQVAPWMVGRSLGSKGETCQVGGAQETRQIQEPTRQRKRGRQLRSSQAFRHQGRQRGQRRGGAMAKHYSCKKNHSSTCPPLQKQIRTQ